MASKKEIVFQSAFAKYTSVGIIGQGGAGIVYRCQDENGNFLAVKLLRPETVTRDKLKRFKNEILFCQQNRHPNVLTVIDSGPFEAGGINVPFYVMPLYDASLAVLIQKGIKPNQILPLFSQLLDGVEAAHLKKAVHRDLKPENILYQATDNRLVVADFGIAQFQEEELYTAVETKAADRLANFQYAAPEQRKRGLPTDQRTDVYALGLILNEMFTGEVPQGTGYKTIAGVDDSFSYLDNLVASMIRQAPADRPDSIEAIKRELIGQKNEFVDRQKLSELKGAVVSVSEIDDPLVANPPRVVDFDWSNELLTIILNQPVNNEWILAFKSPRSYTSVSGKGPEAFEIKGKEARIRAEERVVQRIIDSFKSWLPDVNRIYVDRLQQEKEKQEAATRRELQTQIEEKEARERLRRSIKL